MSAPDPTPAAVALVAEALWEHLSGMGVIENGTWVHFERQDADVIASGALAHPGLRAAVERHVAMAGERHEPPAPPPKRVGQDSWVLPPPTTPKPPPPPAPPPVERHVAGEGRYDEAVEAIHRAFCDPYHEKVGEWDRSMAESLERRGLVIRPAAERVLWCPAGCDCRLGTGDSDGLDCACDGPCGFFSWEDFMRHVAGEGLTVERLARAMQAAEGPPAPDDDGMPLEWYRPRARLVLAALTGDSAEGRERFIGQDTWPCVCGHPKSDHYFGDALGRDGRMHTWCQRCRQGIDSGCIDFRPDIRVEGSGR